jgi:hypothetical protein
MSPVATGDRQMEQRAVRGVGVITLIRLSMENRQVCEVGIAVSVPIVAPGSTNPQHKGGQAREIAAAGLPATGASASLEKHALIWRCLGATVWRSFPRPRPSSASAAMGHDSRSVYSGERLCALRLQ